MPPVTQSSLQILVSDKIRRGWKAETVLGSKMQSCRRISVWPRRAMPHSVATIRRPSTPAKSSQQPRRARSCEFLGEAGSSDALQSRGTADTSVDCSSNGQLVQISRAALAAAQLSLEEGKPLPADLSAKHCDAAVQEAVVASANTEPAAATVQQSCEFFGEALAFRLNGWIAKTFTLSVAIIRMIIFFLLIFNMLSQMFNSMLCLCISNPC